MLVINYICCCHWQPVRWKYSEEASVAAAKADVFWKNDITIGVKFVKIQKNKLDKIDIIKSHGVN